MPPLGPGIRPVNDAHASTYGQTGRKEAAGWERAAGTPAPRQGALKAPWNPLLRAYKKDGNDLKVSNYKYER